jgi:hypothetical protein
MLLKTDYSLSYLQSLYYIDQLHYLQKVQKLWSDILVVFPHLQTFHNSIYKDFLSFINTFCRRLRDNYLNLDVATSDIFRSSYCKLCGEKVTLLITFDSDSISVSHLTLDFSSLECTYVPIEKVQGQLDCKSGKLVIANHFGKKIENNASPDLYNSSVKSCVNKFLTDLIHYKYVMVPSTNTVVDLYFNIVTKDLLCLNAEPSKSQLSPEYLHLGSISTDVWHLSAMDYEQLRTYCLKDSVDFDEILEESIILDYEQPIQLNVRFTVNNHKLIEQGYQNIELLTIFPT